MNPAIRLRINLENMRSIVLHHRTRDLRCHSGRRSRWNVYFLTSEGQARISLNKRAFFTFHVVIKYRPPACRPPFVIFPRESNLDDVSIAAPCPIKWDDMKGDERVRFCDMCELNVYNISEMTRNEAQAFLAERTGRTCLRLYRRSDGSLITKDCPIGRKLADQIKTRTAALVAMVISILNAGLVFAQQPKLKLPEDIGRVERPRDMNGVGINPFVVDEQKFQTKPSKDEEKELKIIRREMANTLAYDSFVAAQEHEKLNEPYLAMEFYEDAIREIHNSKIHDQVFVKQVASQYAQLLRKQNNPRKAAKIEKRFGVKSRQSSIPFSSSANPYSPGIILFDKLDGQRKRKAYLRVRNDGTIQFRPEPFVDQTINRVNDLSKLSVVQIEQIWGTGKPHQDASRFELTGWNGIDHKWVTFQIDLKFTAALCSEVRITGPRMPQPRWISAKDIYQWPTASGLVLPEEIGYIEGPRDMTDCGYH